VKHEHNRSAFKFFKNPLLPSSIKKAVEIGFGDTEFHSSSVVLRYKLEILKTTVHRTRRHGNVGRELSPLL
jgi:hypothetical protein